jgi:hypothetical protein
MSAAAPPSLGGQVISSWNFPAQSAYVAIALPDILLARSSILFFECFGFTKSSLGSVALGFVVVSVFSRCVNLIYKVRRKCADSFAHTITWKG